MSQPQMLGQNLTDPRLCVAIVDRLAFNGTIIETGTDSYRLAHSLTRNAHSDVAASGRPTNT